MHARQTKRSWIVALAACGFGLVAGKFADDLLTTQGPRDVAAHANSPAGRAATKANLGPASALPGLEIVDWSKLDPNDLATFVQRLRAAGYPETVIRGIIGSLTRDRFSARTSSRHDAPPPPFWRKRPPRADEDLKEGNSSSTALEQAQFVAKALGGTGEAYEFLSPSERSALSSVPPGKVLEVRAIRSDYAQMRAEIITEADGMMLPTDRKKLALIDKAEREDLKRVLTTEELVEHDLRASNLANSMRRNLALFEPSEAEFRAIFSARQAVEEKFGPLGASQTQQILAREQEIRERVKTLLPADRFVQYDQTTDLSRVTLNRVVSRFALPLETANQVAGIQQETMKRAASLASDRNLGGEQRQLQMQSLADQAKGRIAGTLGPEAFAAYEESAASWLRQLAPAPRPSPPRSGVPK